MNRRQLFLGAAAAAIAPAIPKIAPQFIHQEVALGFTVTRQMLEDAAEPVQILLRLVGETWAKEGATTREDSPLRDDGNDDFAKAS